MKETYAKSDEVIAYFDNDRRRACEVQINPKKLVAGWMWKDKDCRWSSFNGSQTDCKKEDPFYSDDCNVVDFDFNMLKLIAQTHFLNVNHQLLKSLKLMKCFKKSMLKIQKIDDIDEWKFMFAVTRE